MFYYPFDTQRCSVLVQNSVSQNLVTFSCDRSRLIFLEDHDLPSYIITSHRVKITSYDTNQTAYSLLQVSEVEGLGGYDNLRFQPTRIEMGTYVEWEGQRHFS